MKISGFFPIPVGQAKLEREINEEEMEFIEKIRKEGSTDNLENSMSINKYILEEPEFAELKKLILKNVKEYFVKVYNPKDDIEIIITSSWINWTEEHEMHHDHHHTNSFLSGVVYVQTDDNRDTLEFFNPIRFGGNIDVQCEERSKWLKNLWYIPALKNHMLVFPSDLKHRVPVRPNVPDHKTRISISFNTWFKGTLGSEYNANSLKC